MKLVLNTVKGEIFIVHLMINVIEGSDSVTVLEAILLCSHDYPHLFFFFTFFFEGTYMAVSTQLIS